MVLGSSPVAVKYIFCLCIFIIIIIWVHQRFVDVFLATCIFLLVFLMVHLLMFHIFVQTLLIYLQPHGYPIKQFFLVTLSLQFEIQLNHQLLLLFFKLLFLEQLSMQLLLIFWCYWENSVHTNYSDFCPYFLRRVRIFRFNWISHYSAFYH